MAGDLTRRLGVAAVGIPVGVAVIYLGGWVLAAVIATVAALSAHEFYGLAAAKGVRPLVLLGVPAAAALVLAAAAWPAFDAFAPRALAFLVGLSLAVFAACIWTRWPEGSPLAAASSTLAGVLYAGGTLVFAILLRNLPGEGALAAAGWTGALLLIFPLVVTWIGDSAAYFAGRSWGRRKLIPAVSPGKTVVGGVAGLVGAVVAGALFAALAWPDGAGWGVRPWSAGAFALLLGAAAQVGDLAESVLKRDAGTKDSGSFLPGHGGALDRFDALFYTLPMTYLFFALWGEGL